MIVAFGDHVRHFPVRQFAFAEITQIILGDLREVRFVAVVALSGTVTRHAFAVRLDPDAWYRFATISIARPALVANTASVVPGAVSDKEPALYLLRARRMIKLAFVPRMMEKCVSPAPGGFKIPQHRDLCMNPAQLVGEFRHC